MENSAFSFLGRQEKILLIVCIGHLLGLCQTMEWTEFFLKNKGNSIFNYSTNQYDHLSGHRLEISSNKRHIFKK